jgi:Tfp pilus assembly protein PilF
MDQIIQIDPSYYLAYCTRSSVLSALGDRQGAKADLEKCKKMYGKPAAAK